MDQSIAEESIPFNIFHTNDLHSHLDGIKVPVGNSFEKRGGYARLTTLISELRTQKKDEIVIGVDAGDFFAGTIFAGIALSNQKDFPEYQFFLDNKYDVMTLGNHEFDGENDGLEIMLKKAQAQASSIPIIASNIYVNGNSPLRHYIGEDKFIRPYMVRDFQSKKGKLRVGFLGILGPDGCLVSRSVRGDVHFVGFNDDKSKISMNDLVNHLNKMISDLREKHKVDVVILSMHGGGKESYSLAAKLKGLNILIAGHTHKNEFAIVQGTVINQTGSYGENLGLLELSYNTQTKKIHLENADKNHTITVTDKINENDIWKKRIKNWKKESYKLMGHDSDPDEVIVTLKNDYIRSSDIPNPMGELITSSVLTEINHKILANKEADTEDKVDAYITSMGLIRTSFYKNTPYTGPEIFEATSIGFDKNKRPGIEVTYFYLTPKEVKLIMNFMEIYTFISTSFSPAISPNLSFKIRKWGIPFINRIHDIKLDGKDLSNYDRLIKIATNKYILANIETVKKITHGWVDLTPKDRAGHPISNYIDIGKEYQFMIEHFKKNPTKY